MKNVLLRSACFLLTVLFITGLFEIYTIAEYIKRNANVFYADAEIDYANAENDEKKKNDAKNAVKSILDSGIKTNVCSVADQSGRIACYTDNLYIELDGSSLCPVFIYYGCSIGPPAYSEQQLCELAHRFVLKNVPGSVGSGPALEGSFSCSHYSCYRFKALEGYVYIGLRADTGKVVFYDAAELF